MDDPTSERFRSDPAAFLEQSIKAYTLSSPLNRLAAFDGTPIFEEPLVGFADGDDPLFTEYKAIIGDFHLTPREALARHLAETRGTGSPEPPNVSVISIVLPIAKETRLSNRRETEGPSLRWNHTRWHGQDFITGLSRHVASVLDALVPELAPFFRMLEMTGGLGSVWSLRHIAYAAGLGTFGLSDGFITPRGLALRCASVVTDLRIEPTPRPYAHLRQLPVPLHGYLRSLHPALPRRRDQREWARQEEVPRGPDRGAEALDGRGARRRLHRDLCRLRPVPDEGALRGRDPAPAETAIGGRHRRGAGLSPHS